LAEERARGDREREETKNKKSEQYVASRKDRNARRRQKKRQLRVSRNAKIGHEPNPKRNDCTDVVVETVNEFDSECESESELPELTKRTKLVDAVMKNELACPEWPGLCPPTLLAGERINGENKRQLKRENKARRIEKQANQVEGTYWSNHKGKFSIPVPKQGLQTWVGEMCPQNLALYHPAAAKLLDFATGGCPANTGRPWTKAEMEAAIERGPHISAMDPDAMAQLQQEVADKVKRARQN
jgi:hypothetical protein